MKKKSFLARALIFCLIVLISFTGCAKKEIGEVFHQIGRDYVTNNPGTVEMWGVGDIYEIEDDNSVLPYITSEDRLKTIEIYTEGLEELEKYKSSELSEIDRLNSEIIKWYLETQIEGKQYIYHDYVIEHIFGLQTELQDYLVNTYEIESKEDAENYISLLSQFDDVFDKFIDESQVREEKGIIPPKVIVLAASRQFSRFVSSNPNENTLYTSYIERLSKVEGLSNEERTSLSERALAEISDTVYPAYEEAKKYLNDLMGRASMDVGVWSLPDGDKYYEYMLKSYTTTDMTPEEIHNLGLKEVERIKNEIMEVLSESEYKDLTFEELVNLRPKMFQGDEAMAKYREALDNMRDNLDIMFDIFPEADINLKPVPEAEQDSVSNYYRLPYLDGSSSGTFFLNLGYPHRIQDVLPLAYHEGYPGHHFQITIEVENESIPTIRKMFKLTGYDEGWALYAERLAGEYGYYEEPIDKIGYLYSELYRAARLVVDTGIHYKKWSKREAADYMNQFRWYDTSSEMDRYILWPGQACAYKVGELKLLDLREKARTELGDKFDIKEFHRVIVGNGSMPLEILEDEVNKYIESKK